MSGKKIDGRSRESFLKEIADLRAKLEEAEQTLRAIQSGEVDALIIQKPEGEQVYSLSGVERVYRLIVETMNEAALTVSPEGAILFCNKRLSDLLKTPIHEVVGRKIGDFIEPTYRTSIFELLAQSQEQPSRRRLLLQPAEGLPIPVHISGAALTTESGQCICLLVNDLSREEAAGEFIRFLEEHQEELKSSHRKLQENEQRLTIAKRAAGLGIFDHNIETGANSWDPRTREIWGIGPTDPVDLERFTASLHPDDRTGTQAAIDKAYDPNGDGHYHAEYRIIGHADGKERWVAVTGQTLFKNGKPVRLVGTVQDITGRKSAVDALRESEERFRLALKNSPVLVAMQDSNLVYQWVYNTRTRRSEDVIGKMDADLFAPEDMPSIMEAKRKVLQTGEEVRHQLWVTANGQRVFLNCYYEPVRSSAGEIIGIGIAAVNLTEQKHAEEALRQSEERYRALFENMSEGFALHEIVTDEQGRPLDYRFVEVNPAFERLTGLKRADVLGKRVLEILPDTEAHWIDSFGRVAVVGEPVHFENYSASLERWFAVYAYRPAPRQFAVVFTDVTVRKHTEQALATAHSQIQNIIDNTPDIVYAFDLQERFIMANVALAALLNTTKEQMIGKRRHEFMPREDADWHESHDRQVIASGTMLEFEESSNLESRSITWLTKKFPLRDPQGTIYAVAGISADISDRKRTADALHRLNETLESKVLERTADLHAANQALEQRASQLRELAGELTTAEQRERKSLAKLLHDGLQQYLVAARMRQSALIEDLENHAAKKSAQEIEGLLSESINVSRSLAIELCPPALDGGIMAGLEWLSRFMASKHGLDVDLLVETSSTVLAENVKVFLFESVRELLLNVVKHSRTLSAKVHLKEGNQRLRVTVSDAGVGLDVSALQKRESGGGLGLFSIRERIALVGGSIEIDSSPGKGSRFTITVPLTQPDSAQPLGPPLCSYIDTQGPGSDSNIRILLADDHKVMRESLALMLGAEKDFEIVGQAEDGNAAVELTQMLRPRIVLMDVAMPKMDGITATRIIAERHPEVHVIGLSLYRADERADEMIKAGAKLYVSKTAPAEDLKKAIRSCAGCLPPVQSQTKLAARC
jgi:PAS domain S-box-containing protein